MNSHRSNAENDRLAREQQAELNARDPEGEHHWLWLWAGGPILAVLFVAGSIAIIRAVLELMIVLTRIATR